MSDATPLPKCRRDGCLKPVAFNASRYCGPKCRRRAAKAKGYVRRQERPCAWSECGAMFKPRSEDSKYCSDKCAIARKNATRREKAKGVLPPLERRKCELAECSEVFDVPRNSPNKRFCCKAHWEKARDVPAPTTAEIREEAHMAALRCKEERVASAARRLEAEQEAARETSYALWFSLLGRAA